MPITSADQEGFLQGRSVPVTILEWGAGQFIQSLKHECLDHFIICGKKHLNYLAREYLAYYHTERPHQGKDNTLLFPTKRSQHADGQVRCDERLGGLLKHYYRAAA